MRLLYPASVITVLFIATTASAAPRLTAVTMPPAANARVKSLSLHLGPASRNFVVTEASRQIQSRNISAEIARANVIKSGLAISGGDIDALVQAVMFQIAADAEDDLRSQIEEIKRNNDAKAAQRQQASQMRAAQAGMKAQLVRPDTKCICAPITAYKLDQYGAGGRDALDMAIQKMQDRLDSVGDMTQEQQLRLQMAEENYQKIMETLSDLMKKFSDTANTLTGNLK